jgi:hypothetical protein
MLLEMTLLLEMMLLDADLHPVLPQVVTLV